MDKQELDKFISFCQAHKIMSWSVETAYEAYKLQEDIDSWEVDQSEYLLPEMD